MYLFFQFLFLTSLVLSYKLEEDKYYFQLYPSEDKDKSYQFHTFNLKSQFFTINSTDEENMNIISTQTRAKTPIKQLSSVIKFNNRFLINTCFGPNSIVEIIDENDGTRYTPNNNLYFRSVKNNLEDVEFCFSTVVVNPIMNNEFFIVTYWTEKINSNGINIYSHKMISFNPSSKSFGDIKYLDTKGNQFYAQSCLTLGNKYIYCNIDPAFSLSKHYHFTIDSIYLFTNSGKINLSTVLARFSNSIYHKPIAFLKEGYTLTGKTAYYFLTEYHDKDSGKTRLMTSVYINYYLMSFILRFDTLGIYYGINIEDTYIDPNLFNHLLPNDELIVIYIMKGAENQNLLLLNRYDYQQSLNAQTKFDKYTLSNYLREDICANPKYMQSTFITSFINYDATEKEKIKASPNDYLKYQRDIGIIISCDEGNGKVSIQPKKIVMPQCLNTLFPLNGKDNTFIFTSENKRKVLDIKNDPNYKSLKNVEIEFFDSNLYNDKFIIQPKKNGINMNPIDKAITISNIDELAFHGTINLKGGKTYQIPYRIKQTGFTGISSTCHLTSDLCYFEIKYEGEDNGICSVAYCKECINKTTCIECDYNIIGIKLFKNKNECSCDEDNGFKKEPNTNINMCVCKDGYSFYQNIYKCLPDMYLNSGDYCIMGQDERSQINIYEKVANGITKYYYNGLPYCHMPQYDECSPETWFKMGKYVFYSAKVDNCVYIIYNHEIILYSNRTECDYKYYDYKNCLNLRISNAAQYYSALDKAYDFSSESSIIFEPDDNKKFYILNQNTSQSYSSVYLSNACVEKVKEEYNLDTILIFIATIKNPKIISTQVEYGFYNPNPQYMNQKLNMSICTIKETPAEENMTNTNIQERKLQSYFNITVDTNNISLEQDEIIIKVQIDWTKEIMKKIKDLYIERNINIFDSENPFYNDVCYKFEPPEKTDLYPQDRREIYFIRDALCESNCVQIGYEPENERMICKCKIKENPDNYENVTFLPKNLDDVFGGELIWPNMKVVSCIWKLNMKANGGFYFGLILLIIYFIFIACWKLDKITYETEEDDNKKEKNKNEENDNKEENDKNEDNKKKDKKKDKVENKKEILRWEKPMEDLLHDLEKIINQNEEKDKDNKIKEEEEADPEFGIGFRTENKKIQEVDDGDVIRYGGEGNLSDRPKKGKRGIKNVHNPNINEQNSNNSSLKSNLITMKISKKKTSEVKKDDNTENNTQNISEPQNQTSQLIGSEHEKNITIKSQVKIINENNINNISREIEKSLHEEINTTSKNNEEEIKTNNKLIITRESVEKPESLINEDIKSEMPNRDNYNNDDLKKTVFAPNINFESNIDNDDKKSRANKVGSNEYDYENKDKSLNNIEDILPKEHEEQNNQSENDSELPKSIPIDSEEENNNNKKRKIEKKKKGNKNKNEIKPNPPSKNTNNNGNIFGPGIASEREDLHGSNNNKAKEKEKEKIKPWLDIFYQEIIYDINVQTNYRVKDKTNSKIKNLKGLKDFKQNKKWQYQKENGDLVVIEDGEGKSTFLFNQPIIYLFLSKFISNSTLFFIFPWSCCTNSDKDGYFIKIIVLILFIAFYMSFNIITATKLSTLHLWTSKFEQDNPGPGDKFINFFIPFIILYLPIGLVKRSLSLTRIYFHFNQEIKMLEKKLKNSSSSSNSNSNNNSDNDDKNNKREIKKELRMEAKKLDTEIKKQRNQLETKTRLVLWYGSVLIVFNGILLTNFCGIYINSFSSLFLNMLSSMGFTFVFSFGLQLISTLLKYFEFCSNCKLSEFLNCQILLYYLYFFICKCSFCLCCDCFKVEFNENEYEDITINDGNNNSENNNIDNNNGDATQGKNNENLNMTNIVVNQNDDGRGNTYKINKFNNDYYIK